MSTLDYGQCGHCGSDVHPRYWSFDRYVEQISYEAAGDKVDSTVAVLECDGVSSFCSEGCSTTGVQEFIVDRGLTNLYPGDGPIELCSHCGKPVVMTKPHVAYVLLVGTETRKAWEISAPWTTQYQPETSWTVAVVCPECEAPYVSAESEDDDVNTVEVVSSDLVNAPAPIKCETSSQD